MLNKKITDIVIGTGLVGIGTTNLLTQLGRKVLNVGSIHSMPIQSKNASLKYQGWLISGATWYFDPVDRILNKYYKEHSRIKELLNKSQRYISNYSTKSEGLAILTPDQMTNLENSKVNKFLYNEITSRDTIYRLTKKEPIQDNVYLSILDRTYESCIMMNAMTKYSKDHGAIVKFIDEEQMHIKTSVKANKISIKIGDTEYQPENLFVCAGANTMKILYNIQQNSDYIFHPDGKMPKELNNIFKIEVLRTPLVSFKNNIGLEADLIADLANRISIARHFEKKNLVFTTSKYTSAFDPIEEFENPIEDERNMEEFEEYINDIYPELIFNSSWMCNRMERKVQFKNQKFWMPTISNWAGRWKENKDILFCIAGKGTLSLDTAYQMVKLKYPRIKNNFELFYNYKSDLFKCQFNFN